MSNALKSCPLSRAAWRMSSNSYYGSLQHISYSKGTMLSSVNITKLPDPDQPDNFHHTLNTAKSTKNVLRIVHDHHKEMNDRHSVQALKILFALQKEGKSSLSTNQLVSHPDFEKICKNIKRYSGVVELNDTVEALKVLSYIGVPGNSTIVQVLFQIIRNNVNSLSIPQILFVDYLLQGFSSTPLVEALRIALPLVFDVSVELKMNTANPVQMADCLHFAVRHNSSHETIEFILRKLERFEGEFEGDSARSIISSICHLPRNPSYEALINKATTDLIVNIDNVSIQKMEIIMSKLAHKYSNNFRFYYQEVLFDTCANYIIEHNIGYKRAVGVLRNMARLHHCHKPLIDYVSTYIHDNPQTEKDPADIYSMAIYLALSDYKPVHWDHLKEWVKTARNLALENRKEILWIRFAAALCVLDIYKIDVLSRALKEDYVKHLMEKGFQSDYEQYFLIWQCLTVYKPDLVELLPSNWNPKDLAGKCVGPKTFPLEGALQRGLGGERFVLTDMYSKLGVQIDHAIIFSNNSPVAFETRVDYIEDIKLEDNSQQLVLIWSGNNIHYTINNKTMRAPITKTLSILEETLKCSVIPINLDNWKELNDFERIPYLMQKIKEKLGLDIDILEYAL